MPAGVSAGAGLGFADFGVPLCRELAALFKGPEEAAAAERTAGGAKGQPEQPGSPEVNNSTGEDAWRTLPCFHLLTVPYIVAHVLTSGMTCTGRVMKFFSNVLLPPRATSQPQEQGVGCIRP